MRPALLSLALAAATLTLLGQPAASTSPYPAHWWTPVSEEGKPAWEILPQAAKPGEVILSKRNELGILSNFAATPFVMRGKKYASVEGFWQMMKYPEGPEDPRAKFAGLTWPHTREQVAAMTAFEAKAAGDAAQANMRKMGIDWVTFEGKQMPYASKTRWMHYALILEAMRAKLAQNVKVREILLATGDLKLLPDHTQWADSPDEWRYYDIWMELRTELRQQNAAAVAARRVREASHAPSIIPDRVILNITNDPSRSAAVNWRTAIAPETAAPGVVEIAVAGDGPEFIKNARRVTAQRQELVSDINKAAYHSAVLDNLEPDTLYAYRVGNGTDHWSEWHQFRTTTASASPLTLMYVGDAQNDILALWSRLIRTGHAKAPEAKVLIHAGDLINRGTSDVDWGEWHRAGGWIHSTLFSMPVPGNHEYSGGPANGPRTITKHWRAQFNLPSDAAVIPGVEETCYYVDVQGIRLIALNSNEKQKEQAEWLDKLLSDASKPRPRWTLAAFHHPIFSASKGRDNADLRKLWQPLFDKHHVDLVMTGHDHTYARSNLVSGANMRAGRAGTVYVVSVSGPKMYNLEREPWMDRAAEDTQLFQVIRVDSNRLSYESLTARGVLYDAFDLLKPAGTAAGRNRLVNKTPKSPERLRKPTAADEAKATN
jgi:predicted NAD-dependent protein-ADP-ribosyltransferase YbiA (DUF1768 family)